MDWSSVSCRHLWSGGFGIQFNGFGEIFINRREISVVVGVRIFILMARIQGARLSVGILLGPLVVNVRDDVLSSNFGLGLVFLLLKSLSIRFGVEGKLWSGGVIRTGVLLMVGVEGRIVADQLIGMEIEDRTGVFGLNWVVFDVLFFLAGPTAVAALCAAGSAPFFSLNLRLDIFLVGLLDGGDFLPDLAYFIDKHPDSLIFHVIVLVFDATGGLFNQQCLTLVFHFETFHHPLQFRNLLKHFQTHFVFHVWLFATGFEFVHNLL